MQLRKASRYQPENILRRFKPAQIHEIGTQAVRNRLVKLLLAQELVIDHRLYERLAGLVHFLSEIIDLGWINNALLDKDLEDLLSVHNGEEKNRNGSDMDGKMRRNDVNTGFGGWKTAVIA